MRIYKIGVISHSAISSFIIQILKRRERMKCYECKVPSRVPLPYKMSLAKLRAFFMAVNNQEDSKINNCRNLWFRYNYYMRQKEVAEFRTNLKTQKCKKSHFTLDSFLWFIEKYDKFVVSFKLISSKVW